MQFSNIVIGEMEEGRRQVDDAVFTDFSKAF
jgi:hypothetical protein